MSKINPFTIRQAQNPGNPLTENLDFQPQFYKKKSQLNPQNKQIPQNSTWVYL